MRSRGDLLFLQDLLGVLDFWAAFARIWALLDNNPGCAMALVVPSHFELQDVLSVAADLFALLASNCIALIAGHHLLHVLALDRGLLPGVHLEALSQGGNRFLASRQVLLDPRRFSPELHVISLQSFLIVNDQIYLFWSCILFSISSNLWFEPFRSAIVASIWINDLCSSPSKKCHPNFPLSHLDHHHTGPPANL